MFSIFMLLLFVIGIMLGNWQLGRAAYKEKVQLQREINTSKSVTRLSSNEQGKNLQLMLYRDVYVDGDFDMQHQILLDNQKYQGQPGYYILTPMRLQGSDMHVLVNRGWIKQGHDRRVIPQIPSAAKAVTVEGRLEKIPSVGMKMGEPGEAGPVWPKRLIYVEMPWLEQQTGFKFLPYVLYQTKGEDIGLVRDWGERFDSVERMTADKHNGYALQWFSLALLVVVMYLVLSVKKVELNE